MYELSDREVAQVSGGIGPLGIIAIDLALNGVLIAYASYAAGNWYHMPARPR